MKKIIINGVHFLSLLALLYNNDLILTRQKRYGNRKN